MGLASRSANPDANHLAPIDLAPIDAQWFGPARTGASGRRLPILTESLWRTKSASGLHEGQGATPRRTHSFAAPTASVQHLWQQGEGRRTEHLSGRLRMASGGPAEERGYSALIPLSLDHECGQHPQFSTGNPLGQAPGIWVNWEMGPPRKWRH